MRRLRWQVPLVLVAATTMGALSWRHAQAAAWARTAARSPEVEITFDLSTGENGFVETLLLDSSSQLVATNRGEIAAADAHVGDRIAFDENRTGVITAIAPRASKANVSGGERVLGVSEVVSREEVVVRSGHDVVKTTPEHRFFVADKGWVRADALEAGDAVAAANGPNVKLEAVEHHAVAPRPVWNLLVEHEHTFHVGRDGLLVHNGSCVAMPVKPMATRPPQPSPVVPRPFVPLRPVAPARTVAVRAAGEDVGRMRYRPLQDNPFPARVDYDAVDFKKFIPPAERLPLDDGLQESADKVLYRAEGPLDKSGSGIYVGNDGVKRAVTIYEEPAAAADRAQVDQLLRDLGIPAPNGKVVRTADGRNAYAVELDAAAETPTIVRSAGEPLPPLPGGPETYGGYVFISRGSVGLPGGMYAGHAAWGLEITHPRTGERVFLAGSVETGTASAFAHPGAKPVWRAMFPNEQAMLSEMKRRATWGVYTSYRSTTVRRTPAEMQSALRDAMQEAERQELIPYKGLGSNCLDYTFGVLRKADVVGPKDPNPAGVLGARYWFPNSWFDGLGGGTTKVWGPERPLPPAPNR